MKARYKNINNNNNNNNDNNNIFDQEMQMWLLAKQ